jgi:NTE family protein
MEKKAIYLAGGGARGAYQAGVLKALYEILKTKTLPFQIISAVSVGSLNASVLAEYADDFSIAIEKLSSIWLNLRSDNVFYASNYALSKSVLRNLSHLLVHQKEAGFLLDTTPLQELINDNVDFSRMTLNLNTHIIDTIEILTQCYETQQTISFYQHNRQDFQDWVYPRHISRPTTIQTEHIMASGALPLFFPAIHIDGFHYGDGSMGLISPLRGVLRFQAEKVMILGTRHAQTILPNDTLKQKEIGFAHVLGGIMNGLFADSLDRDIELVNRMNDIAKMLSMWKKRYSPWRPVETLYIRPSIDVSTLAQNAYENMPKLLRLLLNTLGAQGNSGELVSFLLFEQSYAESLINLGYQDTIREAKSVLNFFS